MPKRLQKFIFPALIVTLTLLISLLNYTPGTFLTGWDTLHPEFNFPLNFSRLFFGVWRSEQGLGAAAGHSHMADLPRVFILWLLHFIFPLSTLRYIYIFLCLALGPLGIYFLSREIWRSKQIFGAQSSEGFTPEGREHQKFRLQAKINLTAFLVSLFYLLNLGTVQIFAVPFDMFPTQFAFLPWIILFTLKYLKTPSLSSFLALSLFHLLASPQAYAAHLWYAFFAVYSLFLLFYARRKSFKIIALTLALNSFWLLPNLYYALTSSSIPQNTWTNRIHSQEFLLKQQQFGYPNDVALNRGFYFDWQIYNFPSQNFQQLLSPWITHLQNQDIQFIGYFLFFSSLAGLALSFKNRQKLLKSLSFFYLVPLILLLNSTPPFSWLFNFLLNFSIFSETFRFIFNKLSGLFIFAQAIYLGYFLIQIFSLKLQIKKFVTPLFTLALLFFTWPIFRGQLILPQVRQSIPDDYFRLYQYSQSLSPGTILALPLHQPSGWSYYSWGPPGSGRGYQGSGFIWFGLSSPITDRDFDRWQPKNEQLYRDFFYSLYAKNPDTFWQNLQKYQIKYILWDQSATTTVPKNQDQITFKNEINNLLHQLSFLGQITPLKSFNHLNLYQVNQQISLVQTSTTLPQNQSQPNLSSLNPQPLTDRLWQIQTPVGNYPLQSINLNQSLSGNYQTSSATRGKSLYLPLTHQQAYILAVNSQRQSGIPLRLCIKNTYSQLCALEDQLTNNWDYFLIPPLDEFLGWQIQINAISYNQVNSQSQINQIHLLTIPQHIYRQLNPAYQHPQLSSQKHTVIFPNNSLIKVRAGFLPPTSGTAPPYLILNQSFDPGWLAFYFQGLKPVFLKNHQTFNSWANSWSLPSSSPTIYILFWPQLLQFLGFALIPLAFVLFKPIPISKP